MDDRDLAFHFPGGQTQEIFFADLQRALAEPEQVAPKRGGFERRRVGMRSDFAALNKDLLVQCETGRLTSVRFGRHRLGIEGFDGFDNRGFVGRRENESVADTDLAGGDATGDDTTGIELVHILDRKAERLAYGFQFFSEEP